MTDLMFKPPALEIPLSLRGLPGGGSKIYDRSQYGNHGTITGAIWEKLPSGLWCLSFDGSDDIVTVASADCLNFGDSSFTLLLWVKKIGTSGDLIGKRGIFQTGHWGFSFANATTIRFYTGTTQTEVAALTNYENNWCHYGLVVNRADDNLYVYQQGEYVKKEAFSGQSFTNAAAFTVGGFVLPAWNNLQAYIALCSLHKRVLSALEMKANFNREKHLFGVW